VKKQVTQSFNFQFGSTVELIPVFGGKLVFNRYNWWQCDIWTQVPAKSGTKSNGIGELSRKFDFETESKVAFEMVKGNGKNAKKWF